MRDDDTVKAEFAIYAPMFGETKGFMSLTATTIYLVRVVQTSAAGDGIVDVPVIERASGSATCKGDKNSFVIASAIVTLDLANFIAGCNLGQPSSFNQNTEANFKVDVPVLVRKSVNGEIVSSTFDQESEGQFEATADPSFQIDPSFPFADDFALQFSPDAPASVPEPATVMLFGLAMVLAAAVRRRG